MIAVEDRLTAVESKVEELRERLLEQSKSMRQSLHQEMETLLQKLRQESNWIPKISGSMKDYPEFDEVVQLGLEARREDSPVEESEN